MIKINELLISRVLELQTNFEIQISQPNIIFEGCSDHRTFVRGLLAIENMRTNSQIFTWNLRRVFQTQMTREKSSSHRTPAKAQQATENLRKIPYYGKTYKRSSIVEELGCLFYLQPTCEVISIKSSPLQNIYVFKDLLFRKPERKVF